MPLLKAYPFANRLGLGREIRKIREMSINCNRSYTSSVRRAHVIDLLERKGHFEAFKKDHWPFGNAKGGVQKVARYARIRADFEAFLRRKR